MRNAARRAETANYRIEIAIPAADAVFPEAIRSETPACAEAGGGIENERTMMEVRT